MDIRITKTTAPKVKPPEAELGFGKYFSDHLFAMDYSAEKGWFDARIQPYAPFQMDPAAGVFHYGQAMFEGSKAFRGDDGHIRLFRPEQHARRMAIGAPRLCMPTPTEAADGRGGEGAGEGRRRLGAEVRRHLAVPAAHADRDRGLPRGAAGQQVPLLRDRLARRQLLRRQGPQGGAHLGRDPRRARAARWPGRRPRPARTTPPRCSRR